MNNFKSSFINTIMSRGYFYQCTNLESLDEIASTDVIIGYNGCDATADSLHVGHMMQIMLLRRLQQHGHKPIIVVGGGTTKIGDPSGKDESRQILTEQQIDQNIKKITPIFSKFLSFGNKTNDAIIVNNDDWLKHLNYIEFLRDYGKYFSVNRMLSFDSVKLRLDRQQPLSFLEFNYMILQAYDFLELFRRYNCRLQMGGSDQWGNIVSGIDLAKRLEHQELFGLCTSLLTTASGTKMGKTASGAVWLDSEKLNPYDFWQYWRNTDDADVGKFLKLFTDIPLDEVSRLEKLPGAEINHAKIMLANAITTLVHGKDEAEKSAETARLTFSEGKIGEALPIFEMSLSKLDHGIPAFELFKQSGLTTSNAEARRLIQGGGAKVNDEKITDEMFKITKNFMNEDGIIKLSAGRKKHALIKVS
ncbi:MAG: tyrosine--tRNA ligase [Alphaproteobacteria bacterium]|nr:tyrosine--tRNA ligase [Alphaproteobacteria bacterium]